jgi:hypothetical protein
MIRAFGIIFGACLSLIAGLTVLLFLFAWLVS